MAFVVHLTVADELFWNSSNLKENESLQPLQARQIMSCPNLFDVKWPLHITAVQHGCWKIPLLAKRAASLEPQWAWGMILLAVPAFTEIHIAFFSESFWMVIEWHACRRILATPIWTYTHQSPSPVNGPFSDSDTTGIFHYYRELVFVLNSPPSSLPKKPDHNCCLFCLWHLLILQIKLPLPVPKPCRNKTTTTKNVIIYKYPSSSSASNPSVSL